MDPETEDVPPPPQEIKIDQTELFYLSQIENNISNILGWFISFYKLDWSTKYPIDITEIKAELDFKNNHKLIDLYYRGGNICMVKVPINQDPYLIFINEGKKRFFVYSNKTNNESDVLKTVVFNFDSSDYMFVTDENKI